MRDKGLIVDLGNFLDASASVIDLLDNDISNHWQRVVFISNKLSSVMQLSKKCKQDLHGAAFFHDIGGLTEDEKKYVYSINKKKSDNHGLKGAYLLGNIPHFYDAAEILKYHEMPENELKCIKNESNYLASRILYIADYVEKLINYDIDIKNQKDDIINSIKSKSGTLIDDSCMDAFLQISRNNNFWKN
jgi:response regulator RpfG family c-di-GMP phosphodiesterase